MVEEQERGITISCNADRDKNSCSTDIVACVCTNGLIVTSRGVCVSNHNVVTLLYVIGVYNCTGCIRLLFINLPILK